MADRKSSVSQTIILAAGNGSRLNGAHPALPKPLLRVAGRPLIEHTIRQAEAAGCEEAVIVLGCKADLIRQQLDRLTTTLALTIVVNPRFHAPNGVSLLVAEPHARERFFLQMADHVFTEPVLHLLAADGAKVDDCVRLLVDPVPVGLDEEDATKVQIRGGRITAIGKQVHPWDAFDTGCFLLDRRIFQALHAVERTAEPSVSAGMTRLAAANQLAPVSLVGVRWSDVDTPQDRERADVLLRRGVAEPPAPRRSADLIPG